jgi:hypothetical protein
MLHIDFDGTPITSVPSGTWDASRLEPDDTTQCKHVEHCNHDDPGDQCDEQRITQPPG